MTASSAIFANGHWRRRDPLAGLAPAMLAAIEAMAAGPLRLVGGRYLPEDHAEAADAWGEAAHRRAFAGMDSYLIAVAPPTLSALDARGLARVRFVKGADGLSVKTYALTPAGRTLAAEIARRRAARVAITRSR